MSNLMQGIDFINFYYKTTQFYIFQSNHFLLS